MIIYKLYMNICVYIRLHKNFLSRAFKGNGDLRVQVDTYCQVFVLEISHRVLPLILHSYSEDLIPYYQYNLSDFEKLKCWSMMH